METTYDRSRSNRPSRDITLAGLDKASSEGVLAHILGEGFDRTAAVNAFDRMTQTKQMVQSTLGVDDARAAEVASFVHVKAGQIHDRFGGSLDRIIGEIVERMGQAQKAEGVNIARAGVTIQAESFRPATRGELLRHIEGRLRDAFGGNRTSHALARSVLNLTTSLSLELRLAKPDVADAIIDQYVESGAPPDDLFAPDLDDVRKDDVRRRVEEGS